MKFIDKSIPWNDSVSPVYKIRDNRAVRIRFESEDGLLLLVGEIPLSREAVDVILDYINFGHYDPDRLAVVEEAIGVHPLNDNYLGVSLNDLFIQVYAMNDMPMSYTVFECYPAAVGAIINPAFHNGIAQVLHSFDRLAHAPVEITQDELGLFSSEKMPWDGWPKESGERLDGIDLFPQL